MSYNKTQTRDFLLSAGSLYAFVLLALWVPAVRGQGGDSISVEAVLMNQIGELEGKLLNLVSKVNTLEQSNANLVSQKRDSFPLGFSRRATRNQIIHGNPAYLYANGPVALYVSLARSAAVAADALVPYSQKYTNVGLGNVQQPDTATFVSPRTCYYMVSIAVLAQGDQGFAVLQLKRNKRTVFQATSDTRSGTYTQGGGSVILHMDKGDTLEVRSMYDTRLNGEDTNTFSVYCLSA